MSSLQLDEEVLESQRERMLFSPEPEALPEPTPGLSKHKHPRRVFGYIPLIVLYIVSMVMVATAKLDIMYYLVCFDEGVDSDKCMTNDKVGKAVAEFMSISAVLTGLVRVLSATILARTSDRIGRKPVLVFCFGLSTAGKLIEYFMVFNNRRPVPYMWLLIPGVISEVGGSVSYMSAASVSYVSDLIEDSVNRTRLVGILEGCTFAALAFSPTFGSIVFKRFGLQNLFFVSLLLSAIVTVLVALFMRESLHKSLQKSNAATQQQQGGLVKALKPLLFNHVTDPACRKNARLYTLCSLLGTEFTMSFITIVLLYPKRLFHWTAIETGYLITTMSSTRTVMYVAAFPLLYSWCRRLVTVHQAKIDRADVFFLRTNMLLTVLGYMAMGRSTTQPQFVGAAVLDAFSSVGGPALKGGILKNVPQGQFGTYMGAYQLLSNLLMVVTPSLFLQLYYWSYEWRPSLPFEVVALVFLLLLSLSLFIRPSR